jgi:hypothetical protein
MEGQTQRRPLLPAPWHFQACPFWVLCPVANYYPYVRVYAHGNGSYHLSGHNW